MQPFPSSQPARRVAGPCFSHEGRGRRDCATVLAIVAVSMALVTAKPVGAADVAAGKAIAESCTGCHGADGISQTEVTPSLAGQPDEFTQWQLVYFRAGTRKDQAMQPIAESLEANDVRNLGAYFASLPPPKAPGTQDPRTEAGAKLATAHRCAFCHGEHYEGNKAVARLSGQREDYLYKALRDFKSGVRTGSGVASMADVVYSLQDDDLKLLAYYMANQP
jgi:cytochrome c553